MVRMMKADAAPATSAQETYEQPVIQFDDQVDVVFQIEADGGATSSNASQNPVIIADPAFQPGFSVSNCKNETPHPVFRRNEDRP